MCSNHQIVHYADTFRATDISLQVKNKFEGFSNTNLVMICKLKHVENKNCSLTNNTNKNHHFKNRMGTLQNKLI